MPLRVLVADDEAGIRAQIRDRLEALGHEVSEVVDGREAERSAGAQRFDVVILDLVMPVQDGLETIPRLKERHPHLRIIAACQPSGLMLLECAILLGAHAALAKPFSDEELAMALSEAMRPVK